MDVEFGNLDNVETYGTGWFIGFSEWTKTDSESDTSLRYVPPNSSVSDLCVKWMHHPGGQSTGKNKPISTGRTISILMSETGIFHLKFSLDPTFSNAEPCKHILKNRGDFVIWGRDLFHEAFVERDSTILTIRWL